VTGADRLVASLPRTSLVVGKGGVGKTTCAVGLAAICARRGEHTLLLSTDPAAALEAAIGSPVAEHATAVARQPNLAARQLSTHALRYEFLERWRSTIAEIIDRGTYLDRDDIDGLVDAALPGGDEIFALLALAELLSDATAPYDRIVVDTAPTGHTRRLLALPDTFRALFTLFDAMQAKHRFMVRALTHRYRRDRADAFLDEMRPRIDALRAVLTDGSALAAVVVTRAEPLVAAETIRYTDSLRSLGVRVAAIIVNAAVDDRPVHTDSATPVYRLPLVAPPPIGMDAIAKVVQALDSTVQPRPGLVRARISPTTRDAVDPSTIVRPLTIVGGKGGVGKTTVACALALASVRASKARTLLVSTDPAPSIADAFGTPDAEWANGDVATELDGAPGLAVRQMDATAAFVRLRDEYQSRIDALFEALLGRGLDVSADRAIVRDLFALAPPGVDELFALSTLGDALAEERYRCIVVDPAPTGHLLRLLEMPAIALDWSHRIMRLMLKYRDVVGLGETAQELVDFAKRTRALDARLRNADQCGLVLVSLDEPLVRGETERLADAVRARGVGVDAIVWNRAAGSIHPLPATVAARQFVADEVQPPPIGVRALGEWSLSWRTALPNS
jgi:arsenite/tail-anchored protein-transporting ATPase